MKKLIEILKILATNRRGVAGVITLVLSILAGSGVIGNIDAETTTELVMGMVEATILLMTSVLSLHSLFAPKK